MARKKERKTIIVNGAKVRVFRYEGDTGWQILKD